MSKPAKISIVQFCKLEAKLGMTLGSKLRIEIVETVFLNCQNNNRVKCYVGVVFSNTREYLGRWMVVNGDFDNPMLLSDESVRVSKFLDLDNLRFQLDRWCNNDQCSLGCRFGLGPHVNLNPSQSSRLISVVRTKLHVDARPDEIYFKMTMCDKGQEIPVYGGGVRWINDRSWEDYWWYVIGDDFSSAKLISGKMPTNIEAYVAQHCLRVMCKSGCRAGYINSLFSRIAKLRQKNKDEINRIKINRAKRSI